MISRRQPRYSITSLLFALAGFAFALLLVVTT
jgi:hypothetical protein